MQEGLIGYYTLNNYAHSSLENEANEFAVALLGQLYIEENQRYPTTILTWFICTGCQSFKVNIFNGSFYFCKVVFINT